MKMNKLKKYFAAFLAVPLLALSASAIIPAFNAAPASAAADVYNLSSGAEKAKGDGTPTTLFGNGGMITKIVNVILFLIAAVSVIMLIVGGFRYIISQGSQDKVTSAKNTILYAIVGLIIAILAYAIVNFVMGQIAVDS
jgi:hypothetical protein